MKLKYYLRGLGVGIVVTAIILTIANHLGNKMSDEDIIKRAGKLGMVKKEDETLFPPTEPETTTPEPATPAPTEPQTPEVVIHTATITVTSGMYSEAVSQKLEEVGIVSNWREFNEYLTSNGYAERLQTGTHSFNSGMSFNEMAEILVSR